MLGCSLMVAIQGRTTKYNLTTYGDISIMSYTTSSIIPFDSGRSYVVRGIQPNERTEFRFQDHMGRTAADREFLQQFERIFLAAANGDLAKCQRVVQEGF